VERGKYATNSTNKDGRDHFNPLNLPENLAPIMLESQK